jgi:hypothetical protein
MHLSALTTQSSKFTATATAVVMAGAVTVVEATTMDGVEAIIMVITIGETSLPLMLNYSGRGRLWAAFSLVAIAGGHFGAPCLLLMLWTAPPPAHRCHGCGGC